MDKNRDFSGWVIGGVVALLLICGVVATTSHPEPAQCSTLDYQSGAC